MSNQDSIPAVTTFLYTFGPWLLALSLAIMYCKEREARHKTKSDLLKQKTQSVNSQKSSTDLNQAAEERHRRQLVQALNLMERCSLHLQATNRIVNNNAYFLQLLKEHVGFEQPLDMAVRLVGDASAKARGDGGTQVGDVRDESLRIDA